MTDTKKYIVQNLNYPAPYPGNLMRSIWDLEQRCREENIELIYCFPEVSRQFSWVHEMAECGHNVYFKPSKTNLTFWRTIIKKYKPIAIHTHFWNIRDSVMLRLATLFVRKTHLILHHHNTYFESRKHWKELLKRMVVKSDMHIACGLAVGEGLKKCKFKNVIVAENAIDYSRLDTYTILNRKDFDIRDEASVCLIFGHDMHRKGVDIAIKAIKNLIQEKELVLCIVIANSIDEAKQKVRAEFGEIPIWVKFLPPRDDIATYYRFADVFLSPSREEGFCYALPEAAYSGCRIIFSDIEGQLHAVGIPDSFYFESESVESLQCQIKIALEKEKFNVAKEYVCDRYNLSKWSEVITNIYASF